MDPPRAAFERAAPVGLGSAGTARGAGSEEGALVMEEDQLERASALTHTQAQQPEAFSEISAELAVPEAEVAADGADILQVVEVVQRRDADGSSAQVAG